MLSHPLPSILPGALALDAAQRVIVAEKDPAAAHPLHLKLNKARSHPVSNPETPPRSASTSESSDSIFALAPKLGLGGGPELGVGFLIVVMLAFGSGLSTEAQALWPFDRFFDPGPVSDRAAALLSEAIQIDTSNPPGNERALARRFERTLARAGLETRLIETPQSGPAPSPNNSEAKTAVNRQRSSRAAVWARLPASSERVAAGGQPRPALILLSHLDTVPADPEEWSVDPFEGSRWDGFVWGRGALDAKGVGVSHLMTMVAIAEAGLSLDRDLIFVATPEEETGGRLGAGFLVETYPELFEGAGYLLTEGGGIQISPARDGQRSPVWGVAITEKAPCWLELEARGRAGHSSSPTLDAAVPRLIAALDRVRRVESPVRVTDEVEQMFTALAPLAAEWDRSGYLYLATTLENDDGFRRRFLDNPGQNALVRNTLSITVLEGAPKTNVAPASARAELDVRLLPGESCRAFANAIRVIVADPSIEVREILSFPGVASPADTPLFRAITEVAASEDAEALVVPRMIGGFTDAHWFRELGIIAYGFVPRSLTPDEARRVHAIDERVSEENLNESIRLTIEIALALDRIEQR